MQPLGTQRDGVGESPYWDAIAGCLWGVDITGARILRRWPDGTTDVWPTDDLPTALALCAGTDALLVSFAKGLALWSPDHGMTAHLARPEADPVMRLNEGKCDPQGRFWCASMDNNLTDEFEPRMQTGATGRLFCYDGATLHTLGDPEFAIPNTMAWSPDRTRFYMGDSIRNTIWVWDYDDAVGQIANRQVFIAGGPGVPDGSCMDAQGFLWTARFGAGRVIRTGPDGVVEREVTLPVANPTACTFGGPNLTTLFVTSARFGLSSPGALDGATLRIETGITGQPENPFRGFNA